VITAEDKKRFQLMGLDPRARGAFFNGQRKDVFGNFTHHCCYLCGEWKPCEMQRCTHAVCVRVLSCCDPKREPAKEMLRL